MNVVQIIDVILFAHQFSSDIEHLLQSEIFRIHDEILIVEIFFPMTVAAFIVAAMNNHQIIECSSPDSATFDILFCLLHTWSFTLFTSSAASLPMTKVSESAPS